MVMVKFIYNYKYRYSGTTANKNIWKTRVVPIIVMLLSSSPPSSSSLSFHSASINKVGLQLQLQQYYHDEMKRNMNRSGYSQSRADGRSRVNSFIMACQLQTQSARRPLPAPSWCSWRQAWTCTRLIRVHRLHLHRLLPLPLQLQHQSPCPSQRR